MLERGWKIVKSRPIAMPQHSKLIRSRDEWKQKAVQRASEVRELKKTRKRLKIRIADLKVQNQAMAQVVEHDKKNR